MPLRFGQEVQTLPRCDGVDASSAVAAGAFYAGIGALVGGAVVLARIAVERRSTSRRTGFILVAAGALGILVAIGVYLSGPRTLLPF